TYFFVTNPGALEDSLTVIFNTILERVSSGTAAAVVANDQIGTGALFQALYDPFKKDVDNNEAKWIGTLHALWIDSKGLIREDGGVKGLLEGYNTDKVIDLFYDEAVRRTRLRRHTSDDDVVYNSVSTEEVELSDLKPIWNARESLSDLDDGTVAVQRPYDEASTEGRHILTWLDEDIDNVPDSSEVVDFTNGIVSSTNFVWFDTEDDPQAQALIQWVRGQHGGLSQFRSRLIDYDGDGDLTTTGGNDEVMRLGDIVHSSPVSVARPSEALDILTGDASYTDFRVQYQNRRQVVYVGANDGMIHAFNAGFFDAVDKRFELSVDGETEHPLGGEIWAYVPKNLLPQLQWTARKDYTHVYYVDNAIRTFEVKIFDDDPDHPNGWGTILVATMNLGGGTDETGIVVDTALDGTGAGDGDGDTSDDVKTKSAVVILDITNPENPPTVLAELTPPNLQFTTSVPQVVPVASTDGGSPNKWYLVLGSGASDLATVSYESGTTPVFPELFVYDLSLLDRGLDDVAVDALNGLIRTIDVPQEDVFIGNLSGADFDFDQGTDAFYFGTIGASSDVPAVNQGSLYRVTVGEEEDPLDWTNPTALLTGVDQPFARKPTVVLDSRLRPWVLAASGRYFTQPDKTTENIQTLYGFLDRSSSDVGDAPVSIPFADLVDVTAARVFSNGDVTGIPSPIGDTTFDGLKDIIEDSDHGGWRRDFDPADPGTIGAERGVSGVTFFSGVAFVPAFSPSTQ
ncbi:MAG: pilus assembly protein, partial [Gammaproteobacteria bacterium]